MGPRLCLTEERRPAGRAEPPVHLVATVRDTWIVVGLAGYRELRCTETSVDRSAPSTDILALPAPANTRDNWRRRAFPANCPTKATTCDRHSVLQSTTAKSLIAHATSKAPVPANRAVSPRLGVQSAIERRYPRLACVAAYGPIAPVGQLCREPTLEIPAVVATAALWCRGGTAIIGQERWVGQSGSSSRSSRYRSSKF